MRLDSGGASGSNRAWSMRFQPRGSAMRKSMLLWGAVIAMAIGPVVVRAGAYDSVVKVVNKSLWDIHELYLSSTSQEDWGPDQLGDEVVASGDSFQLHGIVTEE